MIVNETSIRLTDPNRHKFNDAMSEYLYALSCDGAFDSAGGDAEHPVGWWNVFGKRILRGNSQGFVWCETYRDADDVASLVDAFERYDAEYHDWGGDYSNEEPITQALRFVYYVEQRLIDDACPARFDRWVRNGMPSA